MNTKAGVRGLKQIADEIDAMRKQAGQEQQPSAIDDQSGTEQLE